MHPADQKPISLLNDLIGVNNNRIECYNFATGETDVTVLKVLFKRLLETSYLCRDELAREVYKLGGVPEESTLPYVEFFKAWVDVKNALTRNDHAALLNSCAFEEGVVLRSYASALITGHRAITTQQQQILSQQYQAMKADHEKVTNLRDVLVKS
jgi:uncharacterized protein (TIGR02284 family)